MKGNLGFLGDMRRINVAITRPRYSLWIVGNASTLIADSTWADMLQDYRSRKCFFDINSSPRFKSYISKSTLQKNAIRHVRQEAEHAPTGTIRPLDADMPSSLQISKAALDALKLIRKDAAVLNKIFDLQRGIWRKGSLVRVPDGKILNRMKVNDMQVIWSLFLESQEEYYTQVVKIWDIIPSSKLERALHSIRRIVSGLTDEFLASPDKSDEITEAKVPIYIPRTFLRNHNNKIQFFRDTSRASTEPDEAEDHQEDPMAYVKTHPFSSRYMNLLAEGALIITELPFKLSEDEERILRYPKSLIILGRSGK